MKVLKLIMLAAVLLCIRLYCHAQEVSTASLPPGIWYKSTRVQTGTLVNTTTQSGRTLFHQAFRLFINAKVNTILSDTTCVTDIEEVRPSFQFVMETPPDEFILVRLTGKGSARGLCFERKYESDDTIIIADSLKIVFDFKEITAGSYEVIPHTDLLPGNYAFIPVSGSRYTGCKFSCYPFSYHPSNNVYGKND